MPKKRKKKTNVYANEAFLQYEEEIINNPTYSGMPDLYCADGTIQWETPSNRSAGEFQFSHDKRYNWWVNKAKEIGIDTNEDKWISKVAKQIHPTKLHTCKVCGSIMDTRYAYLNYFSMKRIKELPFWDNSIEINELTHILDFVPTFVDTYGTIAYEALPALLKCKQVKNIPVLPNNLTEWISWIEQAYIPTEPSLLSPGAMADPPDRLDGFHTYNRCCRPAADKGRSKENLASYSTDRRAFENWSDGNWITANKLMGFINSDNDIRKEHCANCNSGGKHPRPCSADHIGPISLGFCHRPEFQLLCKPCNSAKNNRMYYSDVLHLIEVENRGETVATWYADPIWQRCKNKVVDKETALKLSRIMRDNRSFALQLLYEISQKEAYLFLLTLLNLNYADYEYSIDSKSIINNEQIITVKFDRKVSSLKYVTTQKIRKIRVAFSSLDEYGKKENRNSFSYENDEIKSLKKELFNKLDGVSSEMIEKNKSFKAIISTDFSDFDIDSFLKTITYDTLLHNQEFIDCKKILIQIMTLVAIELESNWNSPRYSRDFDE